MEEKHWYVLRDLKRPNSNTPAYLQLQQTEFHVDKVFTPMVVKEFVKNGRKVFKQVPFLCDLLFVYDTKSRLDDVVGRIPTLQFRFLRGGKQNTPMMVSDHDMNVFMGVVEKDVNVKYYKPEDVPESLYGKRVRIIGGTFDGLEGRLLSRRGSKRRQLLIDLGTLLTASVEVEPEYIQEV